jgi:hypothetical protein
MWCFLREVVSRMQTQLEIPKQAAMPTEPVKAPSEGAETPKTLDEYAKAILEAHQKAEAANRQSKKSGREAIAAAIEAGRNLCQAKEQVGHGNWLIWLKQNCTGITERTAQRYMTLTKSDRLSDLKQCTSLWQALICSGAVAPGHLDKNPENNEVNGHNEAAATQTSDSPEIILGQLGRKFAGCQSLYKSLVKASPDLGDALFDACDPSLMPLPILLDRCQYSLNDALSYFGLPLIEAGCVCCGRVKGADDVFESIYPNTPEYQDRLEWCPECAASLHEQDKPATNIAEEIRTLAENLKEFKSLPLKEFTLVQKHDQLQAITIGEPSVVAEAEHNVWAPPAFENEADTIAAIQRLSPKVLIVKDKAAHQLWNVYRHFVSSAVNYQTPGRHIKFFVVDASQLANPVLGIGAISGDFPALAARDEFIGWTKEQREEGKLNHTAVASTIVATQPFGFNFNGGKLLASITTSQPIRDEWQSRHGDVLAGMTTTSLFGVPSMYDQIDEWKRLGTTTGRVPIQPKLSIYNKWKDILRSTRAHELREMMKQDADVSGPTTNYKTKLITMIYRAAGIKLADFQHGHCRGIYFSEFYENTRDFLCCRVAEDDLKMKPLFQETVQQITDRWRSQAVKRYQTLKVKGALKPQTHSYSQLGKMDLEAAKEAFLEDVGR